jgi:hypothetical protein
MSCLICRAKNIEIESLHSQVSFYKGEAEAWRKLWEDQRGGEAFLSIQRELAAAVGIQSEKQGQNETM